MFLSSIYFLSFAFPFALRSFPLSLLIISVFLFWFSFNYFISQFATLLPTVSISLPSHLFQSTLNLPPFFSYFLLVFFLLPITKISPSLSNFSAFYLPLPFNNSSLFFIFPSLFSPFPSSPSLFSFSKRFSSSHLPSLFTYYVFLSHLSITLFSLLAFPSPTLCFSLSLSLCYYFCYLYPLPFLSLPCFLLLSLSLPVTLTLFVLPYLSLCMLPKSSPICPSLCLQPLPAPLPPPLYLCNSLCVAS